MTFTDQAWRDAASTVAAIEKHPFLTGLAAGTLPAERFRHYMAQDALYLIDYSRMLALAASQAARASEIEFWSTSATHAVIAERELHARFVNDLTAARQSPTCLAYTSFLAALGTGGSYPVLIAGVLPCFWIYEHVGNIMSAMVGDLADHPYGAWIGTYADPAFADSCRQARGIVNRAIDAATPDTVLRAAEAFRIASQYEWMFWDAAWRLEGWPMHTPEAIVQPAAS
ncbi:MAG: thiaminase II [Candidimonas sp.]|nr:MAG: thiaminase II [Candidimonas sp.]